MTLIIGVRCEEGVVVGADTIATYGTPFGASTIEQEVKTKVSVEHNNVVIGTAGAVGLSQLLTQELQSHWGKIKKRPVNRARTEITRLLWTQIEPAFARANIAAQLVGQEAFQSVACSLIVALPLDDKPVLLQYNMQAESEEYTADLPIVSIGSGQAQADPFLAFVKRVMWDDQAPRTIGQGIFGVLWTLKHVINVNAGHGVGGNPTIAILQRHEKEWRAEVLDEDRLSERKQAIEAAEKWLASYGSEYDPETYSGK